MENTNKDLGLVGLTSLLNPQHVDQHADLRTTENKYFGTGNLSEADADEIESNLDEIHKLAQELNIKIDNMPDTVSQAGPSNNNILDNLSSKSSSTRVSERSEIPIPVRAPSRRTAPSVVSAYTPAPAPAQQSYSIPTFSSNIPRNTSTSDYRYQHKTSNALTEEQQKRHQVGRVISTIKGDTKNTFSTHIEETIDMKANKLEQIASLKMSLSEEGVDLNDIPQVTIESSVDEINSILSLLSMKNNRYRYSTLAEEAISSCAEVLESVFDGSTNIPILNIAPDYTGYSSTVNVKLHRLRHETSQVVAGLVSRHNVSPSSRILMEMLPSFLLYPRVKHKQKSSKAVSALTNTDSRKAFNNMRGKLDRKDNWDSVQDL